MMFWRKRQAVAADRDVEGGPAVAEVAVLGRDLPGVRPSLAVAEGDEIAAGQVLLTDRLRPAIRVTAPAAGVVRRIVRGPRRTLREVVIELAGEVEAPSPDAADPRQAMLASGLWAALRTRPFGMIPDPDRRPDAILVTATPAGGTPADPAAHLDATAFQTGLDALQTLTDGTVWVCQAPGAPLVADHDRVRSATFEGPLGWSPSAQVERLRPVGPGRAVWIAGWETVQALGDLVATGRPRRSRIVALGGPYVDPPRLVRTVSGASLRDLLAPYVTSPGPISVHVGPPGLGREAAWLGAVDREVRVGPRQDPREAPRTLRPIIPGGRLEDVLPIRTHAVPLMRALAIGDAETAERLGVLALVEEDVAPLNALCTSGARYDLLLRRVLDRLAEAA
jgi:Na+-transporting NADH:ubiquinone oxidoreductase subunit A